MSGYKKEHQLRACLHGGGGPQIGEVTCGGSPHLSCKHDQNKMRDCMNRRITLPKRVTSPTWGPPPPCKQALKLCFKITSLRSRRDRLREERFGRGATKPCGEWGGNTLKSPRAFGVRFARMKTLTRAKTIPPAAQASFKIIVAPPDHFVSSVIPSRLNHSCSWM